MIKRNKKGLTLVEVIGTILIFGLIILVSFPIAGKIIENSKKRLYNQQVETIKKTAQKWVAANSKEIKDQTQAYIPLWKLHQEGYINNKEIIDPRTNDTMDGCIEIKYITEYSQYEYQYNEKTCEELNENKVPVILVNDAVVLKQKVIDQEVNETFVFPSVKAKNHDKSKDLTITKQVIKLNDNIVSDIDTSILRAKYVIYYETLDPETDLRTSINLIVKIVDTKPPVITINGKINPDAITIEADENYILPKADVTDNSKEVISPKIVGKINSKIVTNQTVKYEAEDSSGNKASISLTVRVRDSRTPKVVAVLGNPTTWTNKNVTLEVKATDVGTGIKDYSFDNGVTWQTSNKKTFTQNQTVIVRVRDNYENISTLEDSKTVVISYIDKIAPTCASSGGSNNWTNKNVTIIGTCSDTGGSGCVGNVSLNYTNNINTTTAGAGTVTDKAGNKTVCPNNQTVRIDKIAPTCVSSGGSSSWSSSDMIITGTCTDNAGGSGCVGNISLSYTSNINTSTAGPGDVYDIAGNKTTCPNNQTVKIDKIAPTCVSSGGSNNWTNKNVTILGTCSDTGGSGCVGNISLSYTSNINTSTAGPGDVYDIAGNKTTCPNNQTVKIDKIAPSCSSSGGSSSWSSSDMIITGTCSDTGSGCVGNISLSYTSNINTSTAGPGTVYDKAGNSFPCPNNQTVKIDKDPVQVTLGLNYVISNAIQATNTIKSIGASGLKEVLYSIDGIKFTNLSGLFQALTHKKTHTIYARAYNNTKEGVYGTATLNVTTPALVAPGITTTYPDVWAQSKVATITYAAMANKDKYSKLLAENRLKYSYNYSGETSNSVGIGSNNDSVIQTLTLTSNKTVIARVTDGTNTISSSLAIDKIDTTPPVITSLNVTNKTTKSITTSIIGSDSGSGIASYKLRMSSYANDMGDVDFDGELTENDAALIRDHYVGVQELSGEAKIRADINNDGIIDSSDALEVKKYVSGILIRNRVWTTWITTTSSTYTFNNVKLGSHDIEAKIVDNVGLESNVIKITTQTNPLTTPTYAVTPSGWAQSKTVTISYPSGYTNQYSLDNESTWKTYTSGVPFTSNGTIIARVSDGVNTVTASSLSVTQIDTTPPVITSLNVTNKTTKSITTSIGGSDSGSGIASYKLRMSSYANDMGDVDFDGELTENDAALIGDHSVGTIVLSKEAQIRADMNGDGECDSTDALEVLKYVEGILTRTKVWTNWITIQNNSYTFNNIKLGTHDIEAKIVDNVGLESNVIKITTQTNPLTTPTYAVTPSGWAQSKTVTISYPSGYTNQYSIDGGTTWLTYSSAVKFTSNGSIIARVTDGVNIVTASSLSVTQVDTTAPQWRTLSVNTSSWTNGNVTLTVKSIDTESGLSKIEYKYGTATTGSTTSMSQPTAGTNTEFTTTRLWSANIDEELYVRATDVAGNVLGWTRVGNVKIDKTKPTCTTSGGSSSWSSSDKTITISCDDTGGSGLRACRSTYQTGYNTVTGPSTMTDSITYSVTQDTTPTYETTDVAGNKNTCTATVKIDKTKPTAGTVIMRENNSKGSTISTSSTVATNVYVAVNTTGIDTNSGVKKTNFTIKNLQTGAVIVSNVTNYTLTENSYYLIVLSTEDNAGNISTRDYTVKVNKSTTTASNEAPDCELSSFIKYTDTSKNKGLKAEFYCEVSVAGNKISETGYIYDADVKSPSTYSYTNLRYKVSNTDSLASRTSTWTKAETGTPAPGTACYYFHYGAKTSNSITKTFVSTVCVSKN